MAERQGYSGLQIALHWAVGILIVFNYFVSDGMGDALDHMLEGEGGPVDSIVPTLHVWVGVTVLVLVLLRLVTRLVQGAPAPMGHGWADRLASLGHGLLYLLMLAVPVLGAITWFGKTDATGDFHALAANVLVILALGHSLVALVHQFILKDGLLLRMLRAR